MELNSTPFLRINKNCVKQSLKSNEETSKQSNF